MTPVEDAYTVFIYCRITTSILNAVCRLCLSVCLSVVLYTFLQFSSDCHGLLHRPSHVPRIGSPRFKYMRGISQQFNGQSVSLMVIFPTYNPPPPQHGSARELTHRHPYSAKRGPRPCIQSGRSQLAWYNVQARTSEQYACTWLADGSQGMSGVIPHFFGTSTTLHIVLLLNWCYQTLSQSIVYHK
jgi:hypothetical protein